MRRCHQKSYILTTLTWRKKAIKKYLFSAPLFAVLLQCLSSASLAGDDMTYEEAKASAVQALKVHLSLDEGRSIDNIKVITFTEKQWPDASIGCPSPGINYPQVIIPGYYAKLENEGILYNVHIGKKRAFVCTKSKKAHRGPPVKLKTLQIEVMSNRVQEDLAKKLSMPIDKVKIISIKSVTWPDENLGCPAHIQSKKTKKDIKKNVRGYGMIVEAEGRRYTYHTDRKDRFVACPPIETE